MFTLGVLDHIMIAHRIADPYFGKAQALHGATYSIDLQIRVPKLGPHGVVMDIGRLRSILRTVLDDLDYSNIDDHPGFKNRVSTTEHVAEFIASRMADTLATLSPDLKPPSGGGLCVKIYESPTAYASFECAL